MRGFLHVHMDRDQQRVLSQERVHSSRPYYTTRQCSIYATQLRTPLATARTCPRCIVVEGRATVAAMDAESRATIMTAELRGDIMEAEMLHT